MHAKSKCLHITVGHGVTGIRFGLAAPQNTSATIRGSDSYFLVGHMGFGAPPTARLG
jgi:hypothetical protein